MSLRTELRLRVLTWALLAAGPAAAAPFAPEAPEIEVRVNRPTLEFAGELPEGVDRERLRVFVDRDDVTEFAVWSGNRLKVKCPLPLELGEHVVRVIRAGASDALATLTVRVAPPGRSALSSGRFSDSLRLEAEDDGDSMSLSLKPHVDGRLEGPHGAVSYDVTLEHELEFEGDDDDLADPDAILQWERPGIAASLGTIASPVVFSDSEFLGITAHRRALDVTFGSRAPVSIFSNVADALPSVAGERGFEQRLGGGTWRLPIPGERLEIRVLGLTVEDRQADDAPVLFFSRPEEAHLFGALVTYRWSDSWTADLEVASSDREVTEGDRRTSQRDRAMRMHVDGSIGEHQIDVRLARVGGRFGNPGDPRLAVDREEAELDLSRRTARWSYRVSWRAGRDGLEDGVERTDEERLAVSLSRRFGELSAKLDWSRQVLDSTGADSKQSRSQLTLSRSWKGWHVDLTGGRTDTERQGYALSASEKDSAKLAWRWSDSKRWKLRGSVAHTRLREGTTRRETRDVFVEPGWTSSSGRVRVALHLASGDDRTPGLRDRRRRSTRGTLGWRIGASEEWILNVDLSTSETEDRLSSLDLSDDRARLALTYSPRFLWGAGR